MSFVDPAAALRSIRRSTPRSTWTGDLREQPTVDPQDRIAELQPGRRQLHAWLFGRHRDDRAKVHEAHSAVHRHVRDAGAHRERVRQQRNDRQPDAQGGRPIARTAGPVCRDDQDRQSGQHTIDLSGNTGGAVIPFGTIKLTGNAQQTGAFGFDTSLLSGAIDDILNSPALQAVQDTLEKVGNYAGLTSTAGFQFPLLENPGP